MDPQNIFMTQIQSSDGQNSPPPGRHLAISAYLWVFAASHRHMTQFTTFFAKKTALSPISNKTPHPFLTMVCLNTIMFS